MMIGITISDKAYAAIASILPAGSPVEPVDGHCKIWLPQEVVIRLRALCRPDEIFSDVVSRLAEQGTFPAITR